MVIDGTSMIAGANSTPSKPSRGKDQIPWSDDVWHLIDDAVVEEITRSRMGAKFLQQVHVHKKRTTVDADIVVLPTAPDLSFSIDETATTRIQEYLVQFRLSPAQMEAEGHYDTELNNQVATTSSATSDTGDSRQVHRASTAVSLSLKTANILAQAEDLILFNGQNAVANSPLFVKDTVQPLDPNLVVNIDLGLLNIQPMLLTANISVSADNPPAVSGIDVTGAQAFLANWLTNPPSGTENPIRAAVANGIKTFANVIQLPASR